MSTKSQKKKDNEKFPELKLGQPETIKTNLDPHLQRVILDVLAGKTLDPAVSEAAEDGTITIDVIAKLRDPQKPVPGLQVIRTIGQIATATINVKEIEAVRSDDNILSLKLATELHQQLEFSVPEIQASQDQLRAALPVGTSSINGSGVIVGIIDFGCDFRHNNFRKPDGTTRILYLWDQQGGTSSISPQGFGYGREFDSIRINNALASANPYQVLAYNPGDASHGSHVMDIAAGNGRATGHPGVAPQADLIFVHVSAGNISGEESFGNSRKLLEAADYIFSKAAELGQSAVINISLGTHGGPHDGSTLVEQGLDILLQQPGRAITISAGNSWERHSHASGKISANSSRTLTWQIGEQDVTDNELEVWYEGEHKLEISLITPDGQRLGPVKLGNTVPITSQGADRGKIIHRQHDPNNQDNHIDILLSSALPAGNWGVELTTQNPNSVNFHAYIERDDEGQSGFAAADDDRTGTLGSISCGEKTIAVGSYLSGVPDLELSPFTVEGPTRDGKHKPEVSAPGQFLPGRGILAARSSTQEATRKPGTSMASPHVAGLIALLMQSAGRPLSITEIRQAVMSQARKNPPAAQVDWHPRYGLGRVDAVATVLTQIHPLPTSLAAPALAQILEPAIFTNGSEKMRTDNILLAMAQVAINSKTRVRIQIEIEPVG